MREKSMSLMASLIMMAVPGVASAFDSPASDSPAPVAATRPELKELLERSKRSHPRLPLPPPTEAEIAAAQSQARRGPMGGIINNGRMRKLYLPAEVTGGGFLREPDPAMTLNNTFKTMFFWIVSRANNCAYCQGHQEVKLSGDGVKEETIAALDGDWSEFNDAERAAFAFTRKLTYEPHQITDADLERLRRHYTDLQVLEIITAVGGFNAMNRWTGALAIPQEDHRVYLTPTPEKFKAMRSLVAPLPPRRHRQDPSVRSRPTGARSRPPPRLPRRLMPLGNALPGCPWPRRRRRRPSCPPTGQAPSLFPNGFACWPTSPRVARPGYPRPTIPRPRAPESETQGRDRLCRGSERPRLVRAWPRDPAVERPGSGRL